MRFLSFGILMLACALARAESMRCDKGIVNETATVAELLEKCGEPVSKDVTTEDVMARNPVTGSPYKVGTTTTERWLYRRGSRSLAMSVTIVDGRVRSIERAR